ARAGVARHRLRGLEEGESRGEYVPAYNRVLFHQLAGEREEALRWVERAFRERNRFVLLLAYDPILDGLRTDPRFRAGVASLHLPIPPRGG
ncbi:MAG: TPR end-of-group domain-containing protein, partial [Candidatus Eiseniibacteriota bacterium]